MPRHRKKKQPQLEPQLPVVSITYTASPEVPKAPQTPDSSSLCPMPVTPVPANTSSSKQPKRVHQTKPTALTVPENSTLTEPQASIAGTRKDTREPTQSKKIRNRGAPESKTLWMLKNAGSIVQSINVTSIRPSTIDVSSSAGFELLCTYNWIEKPRNKSGPAIYVPGGPPKWNPSPLPIKLPPDKGARYIDQNAWRIPKYPFEPILWALDIMNPEVRLDDVDIVCNRNSLRKLLDLASGRRPDPFIMDLHMLQNTLFLTRKEKNARAMIRGNGNSGYGHSFEKTFTKAQADMNNSSGHHRVVRYTMGDLNCVVRFEVDACYDGAGEGVDANAYDHHSFAQTESLSAAMQQLTLLSTPDLHSPSRAKSSNEAVEKGAVLPSSWMAEMKTTRKAKSLGPYLPQMWFGRTPHLLVGRHPAGNGVFEEITYTHAGSQFTEWEEDNQDGLRKLVGLLKQLKDIMGGVEKGVAVLLYENKGGPLQVLKMTRPTRVLPEESRKYWSSIDASYWPSS